MRIKMRDEKEVNWIIPFWIMWVLMYTLILIYIETNIGSGVWLISVLIYLFVWVFTSFKFVKSGEKEPRRRKTTSRRISRS